MLVAGLYMNHPAKVKLVCRTTHCPNYEWTVKELGVEWNQDAIGQEGGHSRSALRLHEERLGLGHRYEGTRQGARSSAFRFACAATLNTIIPRRQRPRRRPRGSRRLSLPEGRLRQGQVRSARTKGVVLCYGGFSADVEVPHDAGSEAHRQVLATTNQPGATGRALA